MYFKCNALACRATSLRNSAINFITRLTVADVVIKVYDLLMDEPIFLPVLMPVCDGSLSVLITLPISTSRVIPAIERSLKD